MKGINVKKIAAFAGAAVLFGAAAVAADVTYGDKQLVDQNGQPTVKIYVGSKAMISDGVAAANIAAKIANEAYKSSTLTAAVSGTATCTVGTGVGGTGACSLVENSKQVTLEVTLPGSIAGTYNFKTLITDTIDRTLQNRNITRSEDNYSAALNSADTSGTVTSAIRAVETDTAKGKHLYKIGSSQFSGFADYAVVDAQATSTSYTEEQSFWIGTTANGVAYDSSSSIRDIAVNKYSAFAYSLKFTGNDYGISVCTGGLNGTSDDWTSCGTTSNERTDKHRVKIKFLGSEWIISAMNDPALTLASSTNVTSGAEIKLAKEAKYGIINVGGMLDAGTFKVRLSDISVAVGSGNDHPAIIDVLDAGEQVIGQVQVTPGDTYTFTQSGTGKSVKIHVYKTAPGFTLNAKWAEMAIYTDEITLKDASRYNLVSSSDTDRDFKVSLLWKNKDYTGASGGASTKVDTLREIVIYNMDGITAPGTTDKVKAGDVVNFLRGTPTFKLTYNGVDLTDDDFQSLTYNALGSDSYRVAIAPGSTATCASSSANDMTYTGKLLEIKTGGSQLLGGTGDGLSGDYLFDRVLVDLGGVVSNATTGANLNWSALNTQGGVLAAQALTQNQTYPAMAPAMTPGVAVFYKVSGKDCYNWDYVPFVALNGAEAITSSVKFDTAGDNTAAQGSIFFNLTNVDTAAVSDAVFQNTIFLKEDAGYYGTTSNNPVYTGVKAIINNTAYQTYRFRSQDSATQQVYYVGLGAGPGYAVVNYEPTLVTERGTKVLSAGTTDATFKVAKKIGQPSFTFALADTSAASTADQYTMKVGDSKVFGGVTVKVAAIDANCGSCSVLGPGGVAACTVDSTGMSAVISPENTGTVNAAVPVALKSNLVALDTDGATSQVAILVGGPLVNTMTMDALKDASVDFNVDTVVVKEVGDKIVVAGKSAADTMAAADQFIAGVKRQ